MLRPTEPAAAERALRGFALGRMTWLFAGSDRGAERAAVMATLIMTVRLNNIDPKAGVIWDYGIGEDGVMAFTDSPTSARKPDGSHQDVRGRPRAPQAVEAVVHCLRLSSDGYRKASFTKGEGCP